ncbi:chondroitin sulfate proteoglycan 4-like [Scyliorhinus canicula]|uniref:chondroitin sulfate proteoglycan 4-like n=1 Tax=Scyliorhinus canicula TaxID=7830 RepID=UPI0018F32E79|nr:chondroitin sulfate proteoglycan 4-like [Scyliorhinus canicula]
MGFLGKLGSVLFFLGICVSAAGLAYGASFFGSSYVQLKVMETSSKTSLSLQFHTSKSSGLLFLAAGEDDYWLVELHSGRVQVKLELGSGEKILRSERGVKLNDLALHTLDLYHEGDEVTLTVDKHFRTTVRMPGPLHELDVQHGIFVGGTGLFDKPYMEGAASNFRGCIDEVVFNQHDILSSLRTYSGFKNVHEVSAGCSDEFFAEDGEPISLFSSKSYLEFASWKAEEEAVLECTVRTTQPLGLLLYNAGRQGDFVAMEIAEGLIRVVIGKSGKKTHLSSLSNVNDNNWHDIKLRFTPKHLHLAVDEETVKVTLSSRSKNIKLRGPLFLGGIDDSTRVEVLKIGLLSLAGRKARGGSFRGCLKDVKANSQKKSLKNALVTKDISAGCAAVNKSSTTVKTTTAQMLVVPTIFTPQVTAKPTAKAQSTKFLALSNLVVAENGQTTLESKHLKLNLDFKKLGVRQSQIIFKVTKQPSHGHLKFNTGPESEENSFTTLDLWYGRVLYVHDGSEYSHDQFSFSVFTSSKKVVPDYLKGDKQYLFNITVTPTNDAPELLLPDGNLFTLLENSKKCLTSKVVKAIDIDTNSTWLQFSILGNLNADAGFLENAMNPGMTITTFSNTDLEEGNVYYVHQGVRTSRMVLRVSDGDKVSNTVVLRIMAVPVDYKVINNTGLVVGQSDAALITSYNLSVETNAINQEVEIRYHIAKTPMYGEIQRLHSSTGWKKITSFSQRSVERGRIRYFGTFHELQSANVTEMFMFTVNIGSMTSEELVFPIVVEWVKFKLLKNNPLEIDKGKKQALTSENLHAVLEGARISESGLHYRSVTVPKRGQLLLNGEILKQNSSFSQKDISARKVEYELIGKPHEDIEDAFSFQLFSKQAVSRIHNFHVLIKADVNTITLTNKGLVLIEGEGELITQAELYAETLNTKNFLYTITQSPRFGKLKRINRSDSTDSNDNITTFTNEDIIGQRLMYMHDDSESTHDEFMFVAAATGGAADNSKADLNSVSVAGTFTITIQLRNDEKPVRVVDHVFHVVRNGQRLVTTEDLRYHDPDSDFNDAQLLYTRRGIQNGDLVLVNDTSEKLFQFSQADLEQKRVLFVHHGADSGRFVLFVTDGKHYTSSLLEVSASDPYVRIANNTGLLVQKGQEKSLTTANLSVNTNLFIADESEISYRVFLPPKHGALYLNDIQAESFTQNDLKNGHVVYRHDNSNNLVDKFNFTIKVKHVLLDGGATVRIYLESHQRAPTVIHNSNLLVDEGKPVKISKKSLQVTHEDNLPPEIIYKVKIAPAHGYLRRFAEAEGYYVGTEHKPVQYFTQQDLNDGSIQYVQVRANQLRDSFTVDISNGVVELPGILIRIDIIPKLIPVEVHNFTIREGASKALTEDFIKVTSSHFAELNFEYSVTEKPKHGHIENSRFPGLPLLSFTRQQVEQEFIYYIHDDSESLQDNFSIMINDTQLRKESLLRTIFINITSVNDEPPTIVANKIFKVWVGSVTEITKNDLNAEDKDSSPGELVYSVTPPSNGHLALKSSPNKHILNFTQHHINNGQLVFVHNGAMSGGFNFQVTDGLNFAPRQIFSITAGALVINMEENNDLRIFPGTLKRIKPEHLKAATNDENTGNRTITYTLVSFPKLGKVVKVETDNMTTEATNFTQSMINEGLIAYKHTHTDTISWSAEDSFQFIVFSPPASLEPQDFHVIISYDNTGRSSCLLANTGAIVTEGERILIDKFKLDASNLMVKLPESKRSLYEVWYQVIALPNHGVIIVGERNITDQKPYFSQFIVNKYGITYLHDDSESLQDNFTFAAWLNLKSKAASRPLNDTEVVQEMFNITITPVNDQPPELRTKAPNLKVLQGYNAALNSDHISVVDLDNLPEEIQYNIISGPNNGYVATAENLNLSIKHFTQADINNGNIWFVQDGSSSSGVFYFSVTDGEHRPLYKLFNLEVIPITITLINNSQLEIQQGQSISTITSEHLAAETNGKITVINYKITSPPKFGHLMIGNKSVISFQQEDLVKRHLTYHMTNLSASQDSFEFTVLTSESNVSEQVVNITVRPLLKMAKDFKIPTGTTCQLGTTILDASKLANQTTSNPKFEVKLFPFYGRLVIPSHTFRGRREVAKIFTQKDIELGLLLLEVEANMTGLDLLNDSFTFVLTADNVQPAEDTFLYSIIPFNGSKVQNITSNENPSLSNSRMSTTSGQLHLRTQTEVYTLTPTKTVPRWRNKSHWGNQKSNTSAFVLDVTLASFAQQTTAQPLNGKPVAQPIQDPNSLQIILPLAFLALLLISIIIVVVLMKRKNKPKHKPLISNCPNNGGTNSPTFRPVERSPTVPAVTVTRLNTGGPSSPSTIERHNHMVKTSTSSKETSTLLYNSNQIDAEMVQHCRTTHPTLRHNQYWV